MREDLRTAVENVYTVFARHRLNDSIEYCSHCVGADDARALHDVPLRDLTADHLRRFAWMAMSTWGEEGDFLHFLPRILELFALREFHDGWLLGKVVGTVTLYGRRWTADEQEAIERYRLALWRDFLATWPEVFTAMGMLEALGEFDCSITPYLNIWAQTFDEAAARHLVDFTSDFMLSVWDDRLFCHELDTWLASGAPSARLREAANAMASVESGAGFVEALEKIDGYGAWLAGRSR